MRWIVIWDPHFRIVDMFVSQSTARIVLDMDDEMLARHLPTILEYERAAMWSSAADNQISGLARESFIRKIQQEQQPQQQQEQEKQHQQHQHHHQQKHHH